MTQKARDDQMEREEKDEEQDGDDEGGEENEKHVSPLALFSSRCSI